MGRPAGSRNKIKDGHYIGDISPAKRHKKERPRTLLLPPEVQKRICQKYIEDPADYRLLEANGDSSQRKWYLNKELIYTQNLGTTNNW